MPPPRRRLVLSKDAAYTVEKIAEEKHRETILTKTGKSAGVLKFLKRKANKQTQKERDLRKRRPLKHWKPKRAFYKFRRLETLVKNKQTNKKHWKRTTMRRDNRKQKKEMIKKLMFDSVLLIIRIHTKRNLPPQIVQTLEELRLMSPFAAVIIRNSPELMRKLLDISPFVTFGVPSQATVRDLVLKRGRILHPKKGRMIIKSNVIVEQILGNKGLICVEDIIDVLSSNPYNDIASSKSNSNGSQKRLIINDELINNCTDNKDVQKFEIVCDAINPFDLNTMNVPMRGLTTPFDRKGYWGYRSTHINKFVEKII